MKTKAFLSLLFLSVIFFILQVFSVKAQNVGVGTENPTQKLEVSGNLKIGDNLFITGDSVYQTYENLASYSSEVSNSPGAFVIVTDLPLSTMWTVRVEGYLWESKPIIDLTISGYRHDWTTKTAFVNSSEQRVDVHVASTDSSTLVIVVGDTAANYDYPKLTVSTFRKGYQYPEDEYADNWYIVQKTSLAEFNGLHAVDDQTYIYKQWGEYGDDLFFTAGKVGINYNTPEYPFHLRTFDNTANYPLLESDHLQPGLVDSAFAIRGIVRTNEVDDPGAAIFGLHDQTSGASSGIRGESKSAAGFGVSGYASASSGTNYGVFGKTNSSDGYAGYFEGGENYFEGNVGVGTTSPDQKLEVAGNIKLGDNIMVEGSSTYKVYRNLATYYSGSTSSSGAFVIKTNQTTGPIWSMKITGHIWGASDLFELTVAGYTTSSNLCYVYDGSRDMRVRAGYDAAGKMVIILGEFTDTYSYPNLKVSEFRQSFSSMSEDYADGWTIEQETSMGAYTSVNDAANVTFELWEQNGDDIYYSNGNVGIGTSSPGQ